jgi:hypothetical protein
MLWFKESYKTRVRKLAEQILVFNVMEAPGLSVARPEIGSYAYNELEIAAAKIWCLDRALRTLPSESQFHKAQDVLRATFVGALQSAYSTAEIRGLVLPLFERRHHEYERIFDNGGTASKAITDVLDAMIGNFIEFEEPDFTHKVAAMPFLGQALLLDPVKQVKAMYSGKESVRW